MTSILPTPTITIDLRPIAPRDRHALVFARFDALQSGQAIELVNDHDPQALRVQFDDRAFGRYEWRFVESGPAVWRVRIGKLGASAAPVDADSCCSGGACCG